MANEANKSLLEKQAGLETELRRQLIEDSSTESFQAAYDKLHRFFVEQKERQELYPSQVRWFSQIFIDKVSCGKKVLDIGAGNGKLSIELARKGNDVTGIDISRIAVATANKKLQGLPDAHSLELCFQHGDARNLPFVDDTFDFVISQDLVEHISEADFVKHLGEVRRVLKLGGTYMFWTPSRLRGGSSLGLHLIEYTIGDLERILKTIDFGYEWIDLRLYAFKITLAISGIWLRPVIVYEGLLERIIHLVPSALKRFVVPPIMMCLRKPEHKPSLRS